MRSLSDEKFVASNADVPGAIQELSERLIEGARCKYNLLDAEMNDLVVHISTKKLISGIQVSGKLSWNLNDQPRRTGMAEMLTRLGREVAMYDAGPERST
jgi:hypothetical protein